METNQPSLQLQRPETWTFHPGADLARYGKNWQKVRRAVEAAGGPRGVSHRGPVGGVFASCGKLATTI